MSSSNPLYRTATWKRLRLRVLDRDGWRCTATHPDCRYRTPGSLKTKKWVAHVHHKIDTSEGGRFFDETNLMAVCASYNIAERNRRQNQRAAETLARRRRPPEHW